MDSVLPFSKGEFLDSIYQYHVETWPAMWVITILAIGFFGLMIFRPNLKNQKLMLTFLGCLWIWMGVSYHFLFFASINQVAIGFGIAFLVQGGMFIFHGFRPPTSLNPPIKSKRLVKGVAYFWFTLSVDDFYFWCVACSSDGRFLLEKTSYCSGCLGDHWNLSGVDYGDCCRLDVRYCGDCDVNIIIS